MKVIHKLALAVLFLLVSGQASALNWGQPDGEDHPNVVVLLFVQNGEGLYSCTGTLLTPQCYGTDYQFRTDIAEAQDFVNAWIDWQP